MSLILYIWEVESKGIVCSLLLFCKVFLSLAKYSLFYFILFWNLKFYQLFLALILDTLLIICSYDFVSQVVCSLSICDSIFDVDIIDSIWEEVLNILYSDIPFMFHWYTIFALYLFWKIDFFFLLWCLVQLTLRNIIFRLFSFYFINLKFTFWIRYLFIHHIYSTWITELLSLQGMWDIPMC